MECNKDEATRAKEIAEKKFLAKDMVGAKKFALKAQNLFPELEGIQQMIATLDVYISAETKINGEADCYGILNVNPQADEETLRKHYRKLALMLHPDKNKSIGAEGAFKHISVAWSLLSDKNKRVQYDEKRNRRGGPSIPAWAGRSQNFTKTTTVRTPKSTPRTGPSSAPASTHSAKPNTFWTVCHRCKMHYEYLRVYLNHNLLCPNCHEAFLAVETAPPPTSATNSSTLPNSSQKRHNSNHQAGSKNTSNLGRNNATAATTDHNNFQWAPFSKKSGASSAAQAASVVQQAYEKVKRDREQSQAATKREEALRRKNNSKRMGGVSSTTNTIKRRRGMDDAGASNNGKDTMNKMGLGTGGPGAANSSGFRRSSFETGRVNGITKPNNTGDISLIQIQNILMEKAKVEIRKKLNEWNSAVKGMSNGNEKANDKEQERQRPLENGGTLDHNKPDSSVDKKSGASGIKSVLGTSGGNTESETLATMSINVPDPDFHDFDKDRTESSFGDNQVWSAYDADDGMPRYYALIHNVISLNPFKMRISWLNSKTNSELGPLNWVGSGFSKTCGDFRVGKYEINSSLNSFSHKVRWTKGSRGVICIYPRKGDVWALYRNWSPDWNELTTDDVIHKYDMVEVLEDYNEVEGVSVTPLVKVAAFKTVFHRHLDPREVRKIPKEEMFRFSHHVPSYLLTGQEAPNAPKGCRELDPAATPFELFHVITDVKEEDTAEVEEIKDTKAVDSVEKTNVKVTVEILEEAREEDIAEVEEIKHTNAVDGVEKTNVKVTVEILDDATEEETPANLNDIPVVEIMEDAIEFKKGEKVEHVEEKGG